MTDDMAWGDDAAGLRLGIRTEASRYLRGEPVMLRIVLQNSSAAPARMTVTHPLRDYVFDVSGEKGWVAMTDEGTRTVQADWSAVRRSVTTVPVSEIKEIARVDIDTWFRVDRPDTYRVRVHREPPLDTGIRLSSGTWTFLRV